MIPADDWVSSAMSNDAAVVELLFRLKQSSEGFTVQFPLLPSMEHKLLFVGWGNRKLRSTTARKEQSESTRESPTTPLCVGALASDWYHESSDVYSVNRSKGAFNNDNASTSSSSKRSRKEKTFAELQEEEILQLKESIHLNKEVENLRINLEEQKSRNQSLKNDFATQPTNMTEARTVEAFAFECRQTPPCLTRKENKNRDRNFILPDLNMEPTDQEEYPGFVMS